ncbi:hypothetical protein EMCRGX_G015447 [Ephydatia muelleri]
MSWYYYLSYHLIAAILVPAAISGADITFAEQPYPGNIYAYVGVVLTVPCRASTTTPPPHSVSTTLYLNSAPFNIYFPPSRFEAEADDDGHIVGFVVGGVQRGDNGTTFSCSVGSGDTLMWSTVGTLIVRDGVPGSVEGVAQIGQPSLHCTTVGWSPAPSPPDSPVLLYTITMATVGAYFVTVVALNVLGYGDPSPRITIRTAFPIVTTPPSDVQAVPVTSPDSGTMINISWRPPLVDSELMTPLEGYVVFYGTDADHTSNLTLTSAATSTYIRGVRVGVAYKAGVAAKNSAGLSNVTYLSQPIYISNPTVPPLPPSTIAATTGMLLLPTSFPASSPDTSLHMFYIVLGSLAGAILCLILVAIVLIACMVWRKRHIGDSINLRSREAAGGGGGGGVTWQREEIRSNCPFESHQGVSNVGAPSSVSHQYSL